MNMTELNVGSGLCDIESTATLDGDSYIINGTKRWIANGPICDICFVLASTERTEGRCGLSILLADNHEYPLKRYFIDARTLFLSDGPPKNPRGWLSGVKFWA